MYIVISRTPEGVLKGSVLPFEHHSLGAAKKEAERLSNLYKDRTFYPMKMLKGYTKARANPILAPNGGVKYAHVFN